MIGASIVLFATFLYSKPDAPKEEVTYIPLENTKVDDDDGAASIASVSNGDLGVRSATPSGNDPKRYE